MSKLNLVREIYNRPTIDQAMGEVVRDYIIYVENNDKVADIDYIVRTTKKQIIKERTDLHST